MSNKNKQANPELILIAQKCQFQNKNKTINTNFKKTQLFKMSISPRRNRYSNQSQNTSIKYQSNYLSNTKSSSPDQKLRLNSQNKKVNQFMNHNLSPEKDIKNFSPNNQSIELQHKKRESPLDNKQLDYNRKNIYQQLKNTYEKPKNNERDFSDKKQERNQNVQNDNTIQDIKIINDPKPYVAKIIFNQDRRMRVFEFLKDLYKKTSGLRNVEQQYKYYIREIEDKRALQKNYNLRLQNLQIVSQTCNAFIQVRGDGNCFYSAFGFQLLYHLLCTYTDEQFKKFIQNLIDLKLRFKISYDQKQIDNQNEIEKDMLEEFIYIIEMLRQVEEKDRFDQLKKQFAQFEINQNGDAFLYGLQTIFLRNLSAYYLEGSEFKDVVFDKENLLIWETECNTNEVIIQILAQQLQFHIKLLFMDEQVSLREYEKQNKNIIILLIKPGHYNIGWNIEA